MLKRNLVILMAVTALSSWLAAPAEAFLVIVDVEFYDMAENPITEAETGQDFLMRTVVYGPPEGVYKGTIDVDVQENPGNIVFNVASSQVHPDLVFFRTGTYEAATSLFDDYGGSTTGAFHADDSGNWWFEAVCNATDPGELTFVSSQGSRLFAMSLAGGGGDIDPNDVLWGVRSINIVPEPATLFILAGGSLLTFLRRR